MTSENALKMLREWRNRCYPIVILNFKELDMIIGELEEELPRDRREIDRAVMSSILRLYGFDDDLIAVMPNSEMREKLKELLKVC